MEVMKRFYLCRPYLLTKPGKVAPKGQPYRAKTGP